MTKPAMIYYLATYNHALKPNQRDVESWNLLNSSSKRDNRAGFFKF